MRAPSADSRYYDVRKLIHGAGLNTICEEARCPNIAECWGRGTATFQILGDTCTRACRYCYVHSGRPEGPPDPLEPFRLAQTAAQMELDHVVVTSVDRDDLPDRGAAHYAATIRALPAKVPSASVEALTPDFLDLRRGGAPRPFSRNGRTCSTTTSRPSAACTVTCAAPRPRYDKALWLLRRAKEIAGLWGPRADQVAASSSASARRTTRSWRRCAICANRASTWPRSASTCSRRRSTRPSTAGCTPTSSAGSPSRARRSASARCSPARSSARRTAPTSRSTLPRLRSSRQNRCPLRPRARYPHRMSRRIAALAAVCAAGISASAALAGAPPWTCAWAGAGGPSTGQPLPAAPTPDDRLQRRRRLRPSSPKAQVVCETVASAGPADASVHKLELQLPRRYASVTLACKADAKTEIACRIVKRASTSGTGVRVVVLRLPQSFALVRIACGRRASKFACRSTTDRGRVSPPPSLNRPCFAGLASSCRGWR